MVKHIRVTMDEERFNELKQFKSEKDMSWLEVIEHGVTDE